MHMQCLQLNAFVCLPRYGHLRTEMLSAHLHVSVQSLMEQLDRERKEAAATAQASVPPAQSTQPAAASNAPPVLWIPPSQASSTSASHGGDVDTVVLEAAMAEWRAAHQGQDDVAGLSLLLQQQVRLPALEVWCSNH